MMTLGALKQWVEEHSEAGMYDDWVVVAKDGEIQLFIHPKANFGSKKIKWVGSLYCPDFPKDGGWELIKSFDDLEQSLSPSISPSEEGEEE